MKKGVGIIIIVIVLIVLSIVIFNFSNKRKEKGEAVPNSITSGESSAQISEQNYTSLRTDNDVFNAIDGATSLLE